MKPFRISLDTTLSAFSHIVATHLPHLQLRITDRTGSPVDTQPGDTSLADLIREPKGSILTIRSTMTVAELERLWWEKWGLRVEVYRRNGYSWADTDYTKSWTLDEQNKKGEELLASM